MRQERKSNARFSFAALKGRFASQLFPGAPVATIEEAFRVAIAEHQAGHLPRAEQLYRQILVVMPQHSDARHLLGLVGHQSGRSDMAVEYIRQAIQLNPHFEVYYLNLGGVFLDLGRFDEAIDCFKQALAIRPDLAPAYYNLANALRLRGQFDEAVRYGREALRLSPGYAEAHNALGAALQEQGLLAEAESEFEHAMRLKPELADAYFNLGNVLRLQRRFDDAVRLVRTVLPVAAAIVASLVEPGGSLARARSDRGSASQPARSVAAQPAMSKLCRIWPWSCKLSRTRTWRSSISTWRMPLPAVGRLWRFNPTSCPRM